LDGRLGTGKSLNTSALSGGEHTISLTVTDSHGVTATDTIRIFVNFQPRVEILSPLTGREYTVGTAISFRGRGEDTEDGTFADEALAWTSSLDGILGTGGTLTLDTLSVGSHKISLAVTDSHGSKVTVAVTIKVVPPAAPVVKIERPEAGRLYKTGREIIFAASANDREDGILIGDALVWHSNLDG